VAMAETDALLALGVPVGLLGVDHPEFIATRIDDARGASLAVGHLLELGVKKAPAKYSPP